MLTNYKSYYGNIYISHKIDLHDLYTRPSSICFSDHCIRGPQSKLSMQLALQLLTLMMKQYTLPYMHHFVPSEQLSNVFLLNYNLQK